MCCRIVSRHPMLVITYLGFNDYKVSRDFKGVFYIDLNVPLHCDYVESYPVVFWANKKLKPVDDFIYCLSHRKSYTWDREGAVKPCSWPVIEMVLWCEIFPNWSGGGIKDAISNYKQCFYKHLQRTFVRCLWCWIQVLSETRIQLAQFHFISASGAS